MDYRYLGRTGLKVSELCLGTMTFGRETEEQLSFEMMDAFVEAGGNFLDTADVYSRGISEEIVGKWLQNQKRENFIIATKVRFTMGDEPNDVVHLDPLLLNQHFRSAPSSPFNEPRA